MPQRLGDHLKTNGNHVGQFNIANQLPQGSAILSYNFFTFPVKHNWYEKADLELIERSAMELRAILQAKKCRTYIPMVGCGNGGLDWVDVKPRLKCLDYYDNIILVRN